MPLIDEFGNESALLGNTKDAFLLIKNTVLFKANNVKLTTDPYAYNVNTLETNESNNTKHKSTYDLRKDVMFQLKNIIDLTKSQKSYEELAKYGAIILITVK